MIEIKQLSKSFRTKSGVVSALNNINLKIESGDIFGIIGMSGAGKSTLLRCLSMIERPTQGDIILDGQSIGVLRGAEKRRAQRKIGVVFQGYNLLMQRSVAKNVAFPLTLSRYDKSAVDSRVKELLSLVGLSEKEYAYPSQLSGGQMQRVALAQALAVNPRVLLCDEPTSALDSLTTRSVLGLLKNINSQLGVTIVIITHELAVVKAICNRVAVIDEAEIAETGDTAEVFAAPKSQITRSLLGLEADLGE